MFLARENKCLGLRPTENLNRKKRKEGAPESERTTRRDGTMVMATGGSKQVKFIKAECPSQQTVGENNPK